MKKHTIWLNLITICLCISAIAIGVYSAKIAELNVGGTIGFKAHDCDVLIWGDVQGAVTDSESTTAPTKITTLYSSTSTEVNEAKPLQIIGDSTEKLQMPSSGIFFYDYAGDSAPDIVLTIHCKNNSPFAIKIDCDLDALTKSLEDASNITYSTNIPSKIGKNKTGDIVITFHLTSKLQDVSCNFDLPISFSMAADLTQFVKHDDTNNYYYIEMGKSSKGEALKWVPIAKQNDSGVFEKFDYKTTQPVLGETYYFLSTQSITEAAGHGVVPYAYVEHTHDNAKYYNANTSEWELCKDAGNNSINGNDYSVSNIRNYLNNKTALVGESIKDTAIESALQLSYDMVYNSIIPRSIEDIYATDIYTFTFDSNGSATGAPYTQTAPTFTAVNMDTYTNTYSDKLWILSIYEIYTYMGENVEDRALISSSGTALRTAYPDGDNLICRLSINGNVKSYNFKDGMSSQMAYYPAFQVTI